MLALKEITCKNRNSCDSQSLQENFGIFPKNALKEVAALFILLLKNVQNVPEMMPETKCTWSKWCHTKYWSVLNSFFVDQLSVQCYFLLFINIFCYCFWRHLCITACLYKVLCTVLYVLAAIWVSLCTFSMCYKVKMVPLNRLNAHFPFYTERCLVPYDAVTCYPSDFYECVNICEC